MWEVSVSSSVVAVTDCTPKVGAPLISSSLRPTTSSPPCPPGAAIWVSIKDDRELPVSDEYGYYLGFPIPYFWPNIFFKFKTNRLNTDNLYLKKVSQ